MHPDHDDHDDRADFDDFEDDRPSKSQLKRDMDALQALGAELLTLPEKRVAALDLPTGATVVCAFGLTLVVFGLVSRGRRVLRAPAVGSPGAAEHAGRR